MRITELESKIESAEALIEAHDAVIMGFIETFVPESLRDLLIESIEQRSVAATEATIAHTELNTLDEQIERGFRVVELKFI